MTETQKKILEEQERILKSWKITGFKTPIPRKDVFQFIINDLKLGYSIDLTQGKIDSFFLSLEKFKKSKNL